MNIGSYKETLLGQDILNGERVQYLVKGNTWFGCYPQAGTTFSFVGCTVSPGFEFRDFELGNRCCTISGCMNWFLFCVIRENLCEDFKAAVDIIEKLT
jgi:predicted cupin superfamily sugar epimerase